MNKQEKIKQLSTILADLVEIEPENNPLKTIQLALNKMKQNNYFHAADQIQDDLKDSNINIQEDQIYGANTVPNFLDYIKIKYMGMPSVKDWSEIDHLTRKQLCSDVGQEFDWINVHDTQFDKENQITYADIQKYISNMPTDQYIDVVYGNDADLNIINYVDDLNSNPQLSDQYGSMIDFEVYKKLVDQNQAIKNGTKPVNPDELVQSLTIQQRLQRAIKMRVRSALIATRRKIALKRRATQQVLQQRARKLAIRMLKQKYAGNKKIDQLSYAERTRVEKIVSKKQQLVNALQRKLLPVVRQIEKRRFESRRENDKNK